MSLMIPLQFLAAFISMGICIMYALSTAWFIKSCPLLGESREVRLFRYLFFATAAISIIYGILSIELLARLIFDTGMFEVFIEDFTDISFFGTILIKPAVLFLGGAIASVARARYTDLKHGGESWKLPPQGN